MLIFIHDYETTGVNPAACGVVQAALAFVDLEETGRHKILELDVQLLNPGEPIPAQASAVHGISDEQVADKPLWNQYLAEQYLVVNDTQVRAVAGYNSDSFDNKIAKRCGLEIGETLDLMKAVRRMKSAGRLTSGKLGSAYEALTGGSAEGAHDAEVDIKMTLDLIVPCMDFAQVESVSEFMHWLNKGVGNPSQLMPYGKHKGTKLCNLPKSYVRWALENMTLEPDLRAGLEMVR